MFLEFLEDYIFIGNSFFRRVSVHRRLNSKWDPMKQGKIPFLIKFRDMRLKNDPSNVFMTFF